MNLLIKNARLLDEEIDMMGDLYIEDGKIKEFGKKIDIIGVESLDLEGRLLMPSFIDSHTHFRDPGYTDKEDLETGSKAALKSGYTFVNLMANTKPIVSSPDILDYVYGKIEDLDLIDMHQTYSITKNFDGKSLDHLYKMDPRIKCISDDGQGVVSNKVMYEAMKLAKKNNIFLLSHPEDPEISRLDDRLSENLMTLRDLGIFERVGGRFHLAHISTKEIVDYVRFFKGRVEGISCEVTPHHIGLFDNDYRVNPSIRTKEDVDSLIEAIVDGTIDMIATDHAPHREEDKLKGAPGISGLETSFMISYTELVRKNHISLNKLSQLMSANPARLLSLKKGRIKEAYDGDLVVLDLDKKIKIDRENFLSKGKNTPLDKCDYYGEVLMTIMGGRIRFGGDFK